MKLISILGIILILCTTGCKHKVNQSGNTEKNGTQEVETLFPITFDTEKEYPNIDINLSAEAQVSFIPLETNDSCLLGDIGISQMCAVDSCIFILNQSQIYRFDHKGHFINRIGKIGHGPEEYIRAFRFCIDQDKEEIYIKDDVRDNILVYTYQGDFMRTFKVIVNVTDFTMFTPQSLLVMRTLNPYGDLPFSDIAPYEEISCQDGSHINFYLNSPGKDVMTSISVRCGCVPFVTTLGENHILTHYSNDTIFTLTPTRVLSPRYIKQPANEKMDKQRWYYDVRIELEKFAIIEAYRLNMDLFKPGNEASSLEKKSFYIDKTTGKSYHPHLFLPDILSGKRLIDKLQYAGESNTYVIYIDAYELNTLKKNDQLKGQLKVLAEQITENSNPVLMLVKFK